MCACACALSPHLCLFFLPFTHPPSLPPPLAGRLRRRFVHEQNQSIFSFILLTPPSLPPSQEVFAAASSGDAEAMKKVEQALNEKIYPNINTDVLTVGREGGVGKGEVHSVALSVEIKAKQAHTPLPLSFHHHYPTRPLPTPTLGVDRHQAPQGPHREQGGKKKKKKKKKKKNNNNNKKKDRKGKKEGRSASSC